MRELPIQSPIRWKIQIVVLLIPRILFAVAAAFTLGEAWLHVDVFTVLGRWFSFRRSCHCADCCEWEMFPYKLTTYWISKIFGQWRTAEHAAEARSATGARSVTAEARSAFGIGAITESLWAKSPCNIRLLPVQCPRRGSWDFQSIYPPPLFLHYLPRRGEILRCFWISRSRFSQTWDPSGVFALISPLLVLQWFPLVALQADWGGWIPKTRCNDLKTRGKGANECE